MNKKIILTSALSLVLALTLVFGGTFALFTSVSNTNISVTSGTVDVDAEITLESVYSPTTIASNGVITGADNAAIDASTFYNGGTVEVEDGKITLANMTPGDKATFKVTMTNASNVSFLQRLVMNCTDADKAFFSELLFGISDTEDGAYTYYSDLVTAWETNADVYGSETTAVKYLTIEMPGHVKNKWQGKTCNVSVNVMAVQGNTDVIADLGSAAVVYMVADQAELDAALANAVDGDTIYVTAPVAGELTIATDAAETLTIRGYDIGTLTVQAPNATIHLYNDAVAVNGDVVAHHSIYIWGSVDSLTMKSGRAIIAADATVETLTLGASEGETVTVDIPAETSVVNEIVVDGEENSTVQINIKKEIEETPAIEIAETNKSVLKTVEFNEYPNNADELIAMIENAQDGDVIVLSDDIIFNELSNGTAGKLNALISITKSITLNLNGMTIGLSDAVAAESIVGIPVLLSIEAGAEVVLQGGIVNAEAGDNCCYGINVNGGSLIIENGYYYGAPTAIQVSTGSLTVNGGHFEMAPTCAASVPDMVKYLINCIDANYANGTATVSINGGEFVGFNPADNASEGANTNYVTSPYYEVADNDGVYTVAMKDNIVVIHDLDEFKSFRDDVNAGNTYAGKTVILAADIDLGNEEWTSIGSRYKPFSGSFDGQGHTVSNLKITKAIGNIAASNRQGLFSTIVPSGATFFGNMTLHNADIVAGYHVGAVVATSDGSSQGYTGNYLVMSNITLSGKVTIEGWQGVGGVMGSGNMAELSNIVVDVEEGSYVSNTLGGPTNSFNVIGSVKGGGYLSTIDNITSNMDVKALCAGNGGLFGVIGGQNVVCTVSNVSYSGTVSVDTSTILQWSFGRYSYNGLLIGAPRFKVTADPETCTSTGTLALSTEEGVKTSNDMGAAYTWGVDLFGGPRDNAYTTLSFSKTYAAAASEEISLPAVGSDENDLMAEEATEN